MLKACVGAGVARGISEDVADAVLALLLLGHDPLDELLMCLETFSPAKPPNGDRSESGQIRFQQVSLLNHGPSMIDLAQAGNIVSFPNEQPVLIAGLAQARAMSNGRGFEIATGNSEWVTPERFLAERPAVFQGAELSLRQTGEQNIPRLTRCNAPQPNPDHWAKLQCFANLILVPADSTNRADAGAGLTDND
ncbi:MAG: hypothetical protein ACR2O8_14970 [Rhizobiaceae bacterium]